MSLDPARLADALLPWFDAQGRHDLPWQSDPTPYRVWVSEVMLQQTQVDTVKPYFERFMARFPDPAALAAAPRTRSWATGPASATTRARETCIARPQEIVARHDGQLPASLDDLMALPGIGRSTAGAILALAVRTAAPDPRRQREARAGAGVPRRGGAGFERGPAAALAARGRRRRPPSASPPTRRPSWISAPRCARARIPACTRCPLADGCAALAAGRTDALPVAKRRAPRRERSAHFVFVIAGDRVLLERRPPRGIWGGLWAPPEFPDAEAAEAFMAATICERPRLRGGCRPFRHAFTHFDLAIEPWVLELGVATGLVAEGESRWHELEALEAVGLPAPVARLLEEIERWPEWSTA